MLTRELPEVGGLKTLVNDGKEIAQNAVDRASVLREYGDDPAVRAAAGDWGRSINYARASTIAGQVPDMGNHLASKSDIPGFDRVLRGAEPWMHFKQLTTLGVAGATGAGEG